ncbi:MAG: diguanylate cyclase response regulator [Nitrospira sp.]|nr:MAG: diguanylate cyclase response regulator [Nitrospira sp.]
MVNEDGYPIGADREKRMTMEVNDQNHRVLVIDDNQAIHEDFRKILQTTAGEESLDQARAALFGDQPLLRARERFELDCSEQGQAALNLVQMARNEGRPYAVAFVDMRMPPGWDGLETIEHLWKVDPGLQVVICTAYSDRPWDEITERVGRNDKLLILQKPFNGIEVLQLASALCRKWNLAQKVEGQLDEMSRLVNERTAELQDANKQLTQTNAALVRSVADLEMAQAKILRQNDELERLASRDPLTGCFNRRAFYAQFEKAVAESREHDTELSCLMVDIDHFKPINDQFGHAVGDQAIQAVASCLSAGLRLTDALGRYGGEEFCLMFPRTTLAEAADLAERLRIRVETEAGDRMRMAFSLVITVSCGVSSMAFGARTPLELIDQADKALYAAKEGGRNCVMALDPIIAKTNASDQVEPQVRRITPRVSNPLASR